MAKMKNYIYDYFAMSINQFCKKAFVVILSIIILHPVFSFESKISFDKEKIPAEKELVIYVTANDWGPSVDKIVFNTGKEINPEDIKLDDFDISREKRKISNHNSRVDWMEDDLEASDIFCSDAYGNKIEGKSSYLTAVFNYLPESKYASPFSGSILRNVHDIYGYRIENGDLDLNIYKMTGMVNALGAKFKTSEFISQDYSMSYAYYNPSKKTGKRPLIIWLHGISEGGRNPYIALFGIKAVNLASDDIQSCFKEGASVLIPQCPTVWLETTLLDSNGMRIWEPENITGTINKISDPLKNVLSKIISVPVDTPETVPMAKTSYYTESLMDLIEVFLDQNPEIDRERIYIGGCSAGGYMTLNMLIEKPGFFAAAIPTCEVYVDGKLSDEEILELSKIPLWFVQAKTDETAKASIYVSPTYKRLEKCGAK
ncbi:MAG: prolyl oligopeptidase family serine peptidase, partial [Treponema sp.]|nr:prolyl oligopeptidase family serine peptidase [Treponema sp.]